MTSPNRRRFMTLVALAGASLSLAARVADTSQKKKGGGLTFLQLPTLTATAFRGDGRRGVMTVEVGIDVPNAGLRGRAEISQPRLRAAYVQALQSYVTVLGPGMSPDADYIARILQKETDRVLGGPGARLLLGTILVN